MLVLAVDFPALRARAHILGTDGRCGSRSRVLAVDFPALRARAHILGTDGPMDYARAGVCCGLGD